MSEGNFLPQTLTNLQDTPSAYRELVGATGASTGILARSHSVCQTDISTPDQCAPCAGVPSSQFRKTANGMAEVLCPECGYWFRLGASKTSIRPFDLHVGTRQCQKNVKRRLQEEQTTASVKLHILLWRLSALEWVFEDLGLLKIIFGLWIRSLNGLEL
ncbi:hypothetical protein B0H10DRAFT_1943823 [Mycena sp. CBHHK59/15]|nr:hypothetical protein B0H10DRAFT_1943823 [Mycena sp. CBHHK59/15]